jgi:hypothetical protein
MPRSIPTFSTTPYRTGTKCIFWTRRRPKMNSKNCSKTCRNRQPYRGFPWQQDIEDSGVCGPFPNAQILSGVRHPAHSPEFTADDSTAKDSALETLEFFGDDADYLLIENSARFKSDSFKATPLYDEFVARDSPTLVVPRISAGTLNAWEAAQHRLGEYLSLDKICKANGLSVTSVLELAGVRDRFLVGCEDCASHLIPDLALIKNKVQRAGGASAKRPTNRLGNPLLVRKN